MIFQHTWQAVLDGTKTQTRRLVRPDEYLSGTGYAVCSASAPRKLPRFEKGKSYAVQPGRGEKAIARIHIVDIRCEDVRQISEADAKAEGFSSPLEFLLTWCEMHDKPALSILKTRAPYSDLTAINGISHRPTARYDAWALTFKLITD